MGVRDIHMIGGSTLREVKRGISWFSPPGGANWINAETAGLGHVLAAERGRNGERYILGGENISHRKALNTIADIVGGTRPWVILPRPLMGFFALVTDGINAVMPGTPVISGEQMRLSGVDLYCDCQKAQQELGLPFAPFRPAVEQAYAWYQAHNYM
jgi:dihydroflavonol-4-reductase